MDYLFVYGTLKYGYKHPMANFLNHYSEFLGRGFIQGKLYKVAHYPGAILSENPDDMVFGHVFKLENEIDMLFTILDDYEGINANNSELDAYNRIRVKVQMEAFGIVDSWIYIYNLPTENLELILSGNYSLNK